MSTVALARIRAYGCAPLMATTLLAACEPLDAAEVLRTAHGLLRRSVTDGRLPLLAPTHGLGAALQVAAGNNHDALDEAALALSSALGINGVRRGLGMRSLDCALASWRHDHGDRAPTLGEALSFIVHALALL